MTRFGILLGVWLFFMSIGRGNPSLDLSWEFPMTMPASNWVFVIFSSTNVATGLGGFHAWTNVAAPPVKLRGLPREYFLVIASNTLNWSTSTFNVKN